MFWELVRKCSNIDFHSVFGFNIFSCVPNLHLVFYWYPKSGVWFYSLRDWISYIDLGFLHCLGRGRGWWQPSAGRDSKGIHPVRGSGKPQPQRMRAWPWASEAAGTNPPSLSCCYGLWDFFRQKDGRPQNGWTRPTWDSFLTPPTWLSGAWESDIWCGPRGGATRLLSGGSGALCFSPGAAVAAGFSSLR